MLAQQVDKATLETMSQILSSPASNRVKYEQLDQLQLNVMRHHPDGLAAKVLEQISQAQTQVMDLQGVNHA